MQGHHINIKEFHLGQKNALQVFPTILIQLKDSNRDAFLQQDRRNLQLAHLGKKLIEISVHVYSDDHYIIHVGIHQVDNNLWLFQQWNPSNY